MVQLLVLYFLSIKATHGYEIQRFIQHNYMDEWNSIKSGSIYYAMSKLEKKGYITLVEKIGLSEKSRKVYKITEEGKSALRKMALEELLKPLTGVKSEKFLVYPITANMSKEDLLDAINQHLHSLNEQMQRIQYWFDQKKEGASAIELSTFNVMFDTLNSQVKWHETLKVNIDGVISETQKITQIIKSTNFAE